MAASSFDVRDLRSALPSSETVTWDLETLNLARDGTNHIVQFGAVVHDAVTMRQVSIHSFFVRPEGWSPSHLSGPKRDDAAYWKSIDGAEPLAAHAKEIHSALDGKTWIGHNIVSFDIPVLSSDMASVSAPMPRPVRVIDTLLLFREWGFKPRRVPNLKLETLMAFYGIGPQSHEAVDDCVATHAVLVAACASRTIASLPGTAVDVRGSSDWEKKTIGRRRPSLPAIDVVVVTKEWIGRRKADRERFGHSPVPPGAIPGTPAAVESAFAKALTVDGALVHGSYRTREGTDAVEILCAPTGADERYGYGRNLFLDTADARQYRFDRFDWVRVVRSA